MHYAEITDGVVKRIIKCSPEIVNRIAKKKNKQYIPIKKKEVLIGAVYDGSQFINPDNQQPDEEKKETLEEKIEKLVNKKLKDELSKNISLGPK